MTLKALRCRTEFPRYLDELGLNGMAVEIGVADGWFSNQILHYSNISRLFSIDPWSQTEAKEIYLAPVSQLLEARLTLDRYGNRSQILKMTSMEAVHLFYDELFDFIYIDGLHSRKAVEDDIGNWYPKLKPGGIIAGHDYCDFHHEVKEAVNQSLIDLELPLYTTECDQIYEGCIIQSWYTYKPRD